MKNFEDIKRRKEFEKMEGSFKDETAEYLRIYFDYPDKEGIIIASHSPYMPWEHVSMSVAFPHYRCPTYEEMAWLKDLFWKDDEIAFQIHPAKKDYVNIHPYVLHLWRDKTINPQKEKRLKDQLYGAYQGALRCKGISPVIEFSSTFGKTVAIFGGNVWPKWDDVCKIKHEFWPSTKAALQFNVGQSFDLNNQKAILLFDANGFKLPPKSMV